jgi:hypothetical protein
VHSDGAERRAACREQVGDSGVLFDLNTAYDENGNVSGITDIEQESISTRSDGRTTRRTG